MNIKRLLIGSGFAGAVLLTTSTGLSASGDYSAAVLSQGPVGYWRLGETVTPHAPVTNAVNSGTLGTAENANYIGDQGFIRGFPGALTNDTAAKFNGVNQAVQTPFDPALSPATWSVEAWLAPATGSPQGGLTAALSCGHFGSPRSGWLIYQSIDATSGATGWNLRMYNQNGTSTSLNITALTNITAGVYQHVAATFDGTTASLYVNGVLLKSGTPTSYVPGVDGPFSIGTRSDKAFFWAGMADEVALYNTVLTPDQIAAHYAAATTNAAGYATQIGQLKPLLYYRLDEPGDALAANLGSLGSAATASYQPGAHTGATGPISPEFPGFETDNKAVAFDGTGGSVSIPALNLNANTVTITAWVKAKGNQNKGTGLVLCHSGSTYAGLTIDPNFDGLGLGYNWNNDPNTTSFSPTVDLALPSLTDSDWSFVALVVQPNEADIYIGQTNNATTWGAATNNTAHPVQAFDGATLIGAESGTFSPPRLLNGAIDEVAIFGRSLAAGEVYSQYAAAIGNLAPKLFGDLSPVSVYAGTEVTLAPDIGGTPPLSYQWWENGVPLVGATSSTFAVTSIGTNTFQVVVTNAYGTLKSSSASVAIATPTTPSITLEITNRTLYPGGSLDLSVGATGGQLMYQWLKDGKPIAGATNSAYTISTVASGDAGSFSVIISNGVGSVTAGPAVLTVVVPAAGSYEAAVVADHPESWWRLDEPANATLMLDAMGRHDGFYTNSAGVPVTLGAPGVIRDSTDTAATSDGKNPWFGVVPYNSVLGSTSFTLECWAMVPDSAANYCPVSFYQSSKRGEFFYADAGSGTWRAAVGAGNDPYLFYYLGDTIGGKIVPNKWMHLAFTYSTTAGVRAYVNGQYNDTYGNFPRNTAAPLLIGGVGPDVNYHFKGSVDEVAFYTTALSQARIQAHYAAARFGTNTAPSFTVQPNSQSSVAGLDVSFTALAEGSLPITYQWLKDGAPLAGQTGTTLSLNSVSFQDVGNYQLQAVNPVGTNASLPAVLTVAPLPSFVNATNGLVLHLRFDGDLTDSSGRGNNGTAKGSPTIVPGILGSGALHYSTDSTNSVYNYVSLGTPKDLSFSSNVSFSVSYWVRLPTNALTGDLPFLCSSVNSYGNFGMTFAPSYQKGGWSWALGDSRADGSSSGVYFGLYGADNSVNDGQWHNLVHTFDRESALGTTYLDGLKVDETSLGDLGSIDTAGPINIGQDATGQYIESGEGSLDDLAVWRRVLTAEEAYGIYHVGAFLGKSFDTYGPVTLYGTPVGNQINVTPAGSQLILSWQAGTLLQAPSLNGPWTKVPGAAPPDFKVTLGTNSLFFRVQL